MPDNDNIAPVTMDDLVREKLATMTPEEVIEYHRKCADLEARLMVAAWVLRIRKICSLSRAGLAAKLHVSEQWVERIERRETPETPTMALIFFIASVCDLHFFGTIGTKADLKTNVVCSPEFIQQYRELSGLAPKGE